VGEVPDSSSGDITSSVGVIEGAPRSKLPMGSAADAEDLGVVESPSSLPIGLGQTAIKTIHVTLVIKKEGGRVISTR